MTAAETVQAGAAFSARELTVRFGGITALDAVSVEVAAGEVLGVIGPNGAGKTTLFNVICGFVAAAVGDARMEGPDAREGAHEPARRARHRAHAAGRRAVPRADRARERDGRRAALPPRPVSRARCSACRAPIATSARCASARWRRSRSSAARTSPARLPPTLPYPVQKRVALARALVGEPRAAAARRARRRPRRGRGARARRAHPRAARLDGGDARRAPHGPRDVGLRPRRRAGLRAGDRAGRPRDGPARPARARGLPRPRGRRGRAARRDAGERVRGRERSA